MHYRAPLEAVLKRDRVVVIAGLAGVIALAWVYVIYLAWDMMNMNMDVGLEMAMPDIRVWGIADFVLVFLMWVGMQAAGIFHDRVAGGSLGRSDHGDPAWPILCDLLLAANGPPLCGRGDELALDRRDCGLCLA